MAVTKNAQLVGTAECVRPIVGGSELQQDKHELMGYTDCFTVHWLPLVLLLDYTAIYPLKPYNQMLITQGLNKGDPLTSCYNIVLGKDAQTTC